MRTREELDRALLLSMQDAAIKEAAYPGLLQKFRDYTTTENPTPKMASEWAMELIAVQEAFNIESTEENDITRTVDRTMLNMGYDGVLPEKVDGESAWLTIIAVTLLVGYALGNPANVDFFLPNLEVYAQNLITMTGAPFHEYLEAGHPQYSSDVELPKYLKGIAMYGAQLSQQHTNPHP